MSKYLIFIILIAAILRTLFLDSHIKSLYGDEISIAYNAWSILHTGKDEFGKFMPIQFESWGDQKNPVYIYLVALFQLLFGLSAWSVRLPSAIAGVCAVLLTYLITKQIFRLTNTENKTTNTIALVAALLLTINPWHLHISRGGYEANLALTLGLTGIYYFFSRLIILKQTRRTPFTRHFFFSLLAFSLAMYTYYTTKLFVPMLIILVWIWGYYQVKDHLLKKSDFTHMAGRYLILFTLASIPIAYLAVFQNGQSRFQKINIFTNPKITEQVNEQRKIAQLQPSFESLAINKPLFWIRDFFYYYFDNLSGDFWYVHGDSSLRYSIGDHGMFYLVEAPFFLIGLLLIFRNNKKVALLLTPWLLLAVIPTALVGKSYGLRSIAMLPVPMMVVAYGVAHLFSASRIQKYAKPLYTSFFGVLVISSVYFLIRYCCIYPVYGYYWYDGMQKDAVEYALKNADQYERIVMTKYYGKTEMYFAYYAQMDPALYQLCSQQKVKFASADMVQCGKYYFGDIDTKDKSFDQLNLPTKTLVIGAPTASFGNETILASDDGRVLFKIIK